MLKSAWNEIKTEALLLQDVIRTFRAEDEVLESWHTRISEFVAYCNQQEVNADED